MHFSHMYYRYIAYTYIIENNPYPTVHARDFTFFLLLRSLKIIYANKFMISGGKLGLKYKK